MSNDYFKAQGWFKNYALNSQDSRGVFQQLVKEDEEAFRLASAETDKIKEEMNKKFGSGTVKYGSEIPQPEIKTPQAIFEFSQRNPAADGGRMEFGRGKKVLDKTEKKNVLNWGKNKSKALGETWSDKKTLKEYNNSSRFSRSKIRLGIITGEGIPGFKKKGDVRPLTKEQQKLWDATMADKVGKWEDYGIFDRGNWLRDFDKRLDQYNQTKNLLSRKELGDFLKEKLGEDYGAFDKQKISGVRSGAEKSQFGQYVDDKLFVNEFSGGQQKYYKKPTDAQIKFIKENLLNETQAANSLNKSTLDTVKKIDSLYGSIYRSGKLPDLNIMMQKLNLTGNQIGYAESLLARIYGGHKFKNGPDIRINKKTSNSMFELISKSGFGNPRRNQIYSMSLDLIDEGLGNEKNTFYNLKNKAKNILKKNGIKVYSKKSPIGFNIDEFAGVTGSGKSKSMAVSQFINIMEGKLNTETLASFQGGLSKARAAVEAAKGTPRYNSVLKKQMELINTRAANLEAKYGIKLARLERPADINNMSADEVKRLKNIKLGTDENLYQRLVKDAKASGYSIKVPEGSLTIQEFTDPDNKRARELIALVGCPNFKGKQAFAEGGRTGFSEGGDCFDKGQKLINSGMKGASNASLKNLAKLGPMLLKAGSAAMSGLILPEAVIVGLESAARVTMGDTPSEAILRATDYLTPDSFFGDFIQKADLMKIERTLGKDVKNIAAQSFDRTNQSDEINKLEEKLKNLETMTESGDFGYVGDLTNQINMTKNQIKEKKDKLKNTAQIGQESRDFYTQQAMENAYDASMAKSKFAEKRLVDSQSENPRLSAAQEMQDMKSQEQLNKGLSMRSPLTGSEGETAFLKLSQLPTGPRMPSEIDMLAANVNKKFKNMGSDKRVTSQDLKFNQDRKQMFKDASIEELVNMGLPLEAILGFNIAQPVERTGPGYMTNYKPLDRFGSQERPVLYPKDRGTLAEGGITELRSKYEYKK